jgi:membrane protease YdiL (CAAX protease family)
MQYTIGSATPYSVHASARLLLRDSFFGYTQAMAHPAQMCERCNTPAPQDTSFCENCGSTLTVDPGHEVATGAPWTPKDIGKAIGIVIIGTIVASVPPAIVADVVAGSEDIEDDPTALTIALGASIFLELFLLGTALWFSVRKYGRPVASLGLKWPERGGFWLTMGLTFALVIGAFSTSFIYFVALDAVGISPDTDLPEQAYQSAGPLIVLGVLSLAVAPLMEETFFRGFVFDGLRSRWGAVAAAGASGLLFAVAHIGNPGTIYLIPPVALIGALFAWGYVVSGSLLASILAHLLFNLVAFTAGVAEYS